MCVIMVKEKGLTPPTEQKIADMWDRNSDGAGFMYTLNKRVYIEKGFMDLKAFLNAYAGLEKRIKKIGKDIKDIPIVMHFRITTHGGTNPENTHPFPVTPETDLLRSLDNYNELSVAHNGIIHSVTPVQGDSDTATYIRHVIFPLWASNPSFLEDPYLQALIDNTIDGSRLAFLDKFGKITTFGRFEKGDDGLLYSNLLHEWYYPSVYGHYGYYQGRPYGVLSKKSSIGAPMDYSKTDYKDELKHVRDIMNLRKEAPDVFESRIKTKLLTVAHPDMFVTVDSAMDYTYTDLENVHNSRKLQEYGASKYAYDEEGETYVKVPEAMSKVLTTEKGHPVKWVKAYFWDYVLEGYDLVEGKKAYQVAFTYPKSKDSFQAEVYDSYSAKVPTPIKGVSTDGSKVA